MYSFVHIIETYMKQKYVSVQKKCHYNWDTIMDYKISFGCNFSINKWCLLGWDISWNHLLFPTKILIEYSSDFLKNSLRILQHPEELNNITIRALYWVFFRLLSSELCGCQQNSLKFRSEFRALKSRRLFILIKLSHF